MELRYLDTANVAAGVAERIADVHRQIAYGGFGSQGAA